MKQKLLFLLVVFSFLLPVPLSAYDFESDGIYYDLGESQDDNGNPIYIASVAESPDDNKYSGDIIIPSTIEYDGQTYSVVSIKDKAFYYCLRLTSVMIPNSVTTIGDGAFLNCSGLTSVTLSNSLTKIGYRTFSFCGSLSSIEIPNSVTSIGAEAFTDCGRLTSIVIPNSVTSIGEMAFHACTNISSVVIPSSVTFIGNQAFRQNHSLKLFIIQSTNVTFDGDIFYEINGPWYIFAPESLDCTGIVGNRNCEIKTFKNSENLIILEDGTILSDNGKTLFFVPLYTSGIDYVIPEGVTKIPSNAFINMYGAVFDFKENSNGKRFLNTLTIPSTIEEIEPDAFLMTEIEKVNFTNWSKWYSNAKLCNFYSNPYWNSKPYANGIQVTTQELTDGMTEIPDYIHYGLGEYKNEIELPRSIKRIGAYAFYNNKELYSVILPKGLEEIGESAFEGCVLLENPSFPAGLKKIEDGAYKDCTFITEIVLPEGLTMLGSRPSGIEISDSQEKKGVFQGCLSLQRAVLTADLDYLPDFLFEGCYMYLDKVYLPLKLKTIGNKSFYGCQSIDEITFPSSLESIGESAFGNCHALSKLVIPDGVKVIGKRSFESMHNLTSVSIGNGIETIPDYAFYNSYSLKTIKFPDGLKEIGAYAFAINPWLSKQGHIGSVLLPSTVTKIGDHAFENVYISTLVVPDDVENLGPGSCGNPSVLTLGSSIKYIDAAAFSCGRLYTLRVKAHMPPTLSGALPVSGDDQLTLIVNKGRFSTYDTNVYWRLFDRIIEEGYTEVEIYLDGTYSLAEEIRMQSGYMPAMVTKMMVDGPLSEQDLRVIKENMVALTSLDLSNVTNLTELPDEQFKGSLLTEVFLPDNLEIIGNSAFEDCSLLKLESLPASVKRIGSNAFSNCPEVNIKNLPESLEYIGYEAFSNSGMREVVADNLLSEIRQSAFSKCTLLERADLSKAAITGISDNVFSGCKELDEVILPSSVKSIGREAFRGTAIRNIDFISEVETIGEGAFSNNRRLVSATLPESITRVESSIFENCPRLISVSMPMGTTDVGQNILRGDGKLANISCAAPEPPEAETGALDGLRYRYVTLAIPTLSFRKYLNATQWGKLECIRNIIKLNINRGVKVTNAAEKEYQEMLKEDALEAAQEAAAQQNGGMSPARAMRRAAARANTPQNFATLFDGAQIASNEGSNNRIFITPNPGVNVISILFDGEELIESFDGQSILLPEGRFGELEILTDAKPVLAESILISDKELALTASETAKLTATVGPDDADDKTVTWSSSDESIALVDENGEVTVTGVGNVIITAACGTVSTECSLKCYPQLGDANWNGNVTIVDAVDISNFVVKKKTAPEGWDEDEWMEFYTFGANANNSEDGEITFADATAAVRIALENPVAASMQNRIGAAYGKFNESPDALVIAALRESNDSKTSVAVKLDNSMEYVALQADIFIPDGMDIEVKAGSRAANHALETMRFDENHLRVALFDLGNKAFGAGDDAILEIVADGNISDIENLTISNILAADSEANEYVLGSRMGDVTGVEGVSHDAVLIEKISDGVQVSNAAGKRIDIFTMEGKAVRSFVATDSIETINLPAGIYIVKAGDKNLKVIL
ncbi:MAG: leucine-rich repeat protein [Muribaculaceae bacterium]|nr:leucine-rich repeat protein [Muribaculaceae bacterium]